jgi:hypothetical protein
MASELIPSSSRGLVRQDRRTAAVIRDAQLPAKRATARIQAAAVAAHSGLVCTEILTALEVQAVKRQGPVMDDRAKAIVDTYAGLVTTELARMTLGGE